MHSKPLPGYLDITYDRINNLMQIFTSDQEYNVYIDIYDKSFTNWAKKGINIFSKIRK